MLTMLGFVILIGIVVNNAILLVHQTLQHMKEESLNASEAILEATINTYHRARSKVQEYLNRAMLPATYLDENPENIEDRSNYAQRILKGFSEDLEREKSEKVSRFRRVVHDSLQVYQTFYLNTRLNSQQ